MGMGARRVEDAPNPYHGSAHYITQQNGLTFFLKRYGQATAHSGGQINSLKSAFNMRGGGELKHLTQAELG